MTDCISRYLRKKGESLVNEAIETEPGNSGRSPIQFIQVKSVRMLIVLLVYKYHKINWLRLAI